MPAFKKILIANRGEIAQRILQAAHKLGIQAVCIYTQADANSKYVEEADQAVLMEGISLSDNYLNIQKIIDIAKEYHCDGLHPGYGFLAENAELVSKCKDADITFIGPDQESMRIMGNKIEARKYVKGIGIPMTQGATGDLETILEKSVDIPLPLLVKAAAGGGGKGMRIVRSRDELKDTIEATSREALAYFGDGEVYVEQYIENPRHIEIQVIGDQLGNVIHLYERECSIQRRYQKILEESPSATLNQETREKMGAAAVNIAKGIGYFSAGTIEFLVDDQLNYYFLEMNTRIQVEHPVTEMVTSVDLVAEQIRVAQGEPLAFKQEDIKQKGHAIEARIYAEDPEQDFMPAPGKMDYYHEPQGNHIRVDTALKNAAEIHSFYDPMISKLIVHKADRNQAIEALQNALKDYIIHGIPTNISFLLAITEDKKYHLNEISTHYCNQFASALNSEWSQKQEKVDLNFPVAAFLVWHMHTKKEEHHKNVWSQIGYWRIFKEIEISVQSKSFTIRDLSLSNSAQYNITVGDSELIFSNVEISSHSISMDYKGEKQKLYFSKAKDYYHLNWNGFYFPIKRNDELFSPEVYISEELAGDGDHIVSPMPGKVIKVIKDKGQTVNKGDVIMIVEAMKMENNIEAHRDGIIEEIHVNEQDMVDNAQLLISFISENE